MKPNFGLLSTTERAHTVHLALWTQFPRIPDIPNWCEHTLYPYILILGVDLFVLAPLEFRAPPPSVSSCCSALHTGSEGDNSVLILWGIFFVEENDRSRGFSGMIHSLHKAAFYVLQSWRQFIYIYLSAVHRTVLIYAPSYIQTIKHSDTNNCSWRR